MRLTTSKKTGKTTSKSLASIKREGNEVRFEKTMKALGAIRLTAAQGLKMRQRFNIQLWD
jgi:hypothetical protein